MVTRTREVSTQQISTLDARITRPIYIVTLEHSGYTEYLSSGGDLSWNGINFINGVDVRVSGGGDAATLTMPLTAERFNACASGTWRGRKTCVVALLIAAPNQPLSFALGDEVVFVSGFINSSSARDNTLTVTGVSSNLIQGYTPGLSTNEVSSIVPPLNSVFTTGGSGYTLKSRRSA